MLGAVDMRNIDVFKILCWRVVDNRHGISAARR
jgi:hypothetical protein